MKLYIDLIKRVLNIGGKIVDYENFNTSFIMSEPASKKNIAECDLYFDKKIPNEYKYFLECYNGGILFEYDNIAGFKFLSTSEIIKENDLVKDSFRDEDWYDNVILFCKLLGNGEYFGFRLQDDSKCEIVHCFMEMTPDEWPIISDSFDYLIENIIKERGKEYWLFQENK
jgi:hypothetical protein